MTSNLKSGKPSPTRKPKDSTPEDKSGLTWEPGDLTIGEFALNLGTFVSFAFLGCVGIYNIYLYQQIFSRLFDLPWEWLQWLLGLTAWALIQTAELMPYLIENEASFMALLAVGINVFPRVDEKASSPIASRLLRRINTFPQRWLWLANTISSVVYLVDLPLVGWHFEVLGWERFIPRLNFMGLVQTILTVVMFQAAFIYSMHAKDGRWFVGKAKQSMESEND